MKKLMIVAAAAFGMAAFGDIESSNIVGYANAPTTVDQNNFVSIAFDSVGFNTMDIQQIRVSGGEEGSLGWGGEVFSIWAGAPDVVAGSDFFYTDPSMDPNGEATDYYWGDAAGERANYSIAEGQAVVIQCLAGLTITTAGEVATKDVKITTIDGNNFIGNPFASTIDIQNIKISDGGAGNIGWGGEIFSVWVGAPEVVAGSDFFYTDPSMDPNGEATDYYWGDAEGNRAEYPIAVGQGFVIQTIAGYELTIVPPYQF